MLEKAHPPHADRSIEYALDLTQPGAPLNLIFQGTAKPGPWNKANLAKIFVTHMAC